MSRTNLQPDRNDRHSEIRGLETENQPAACVEISVMDRLNLQEVKKLAGQKKLIYSPHLGNNWREDLWLARAGVETALFEGNLSHKDSTYLPEWLCLAGRKFEVAKVEKNDGPRLSPYLESAEALNYQVLDIRWKIKSTLPANLHFSALKEALEQKAEISHGLKSLFLDNETGEELRMLLEEFWHRDPTLIAKYITDEGKILLPQKGAERANRALFTGEKYYQDRGLAKNIAGHEKQMPGRFFDLAEKLNGAIEHGERLENAEGPWPKNILLLLMMTLKQLISDWKNHNLQLDAQHAYQAHLVAEHSMGQYMTEKGFIEEYQKLYAMAREILAKKKDLVLPAKIKVALIPGAVLANAPMLDETEMQDKLVSLSEVETQIQELQGVMKGHKQAGEKGKIKLLETTIKTHSQNRAELVEEAAKVAVKLPMISQYDLINGKRLAPEASIDGISLKTLANINTLVAKLRS